MVKDRLKFVGVNGRLCNLNDYFRCLSVLPYTIGFYDINRFREVFVKGKVKLHMINFNTTPNIAVLGMGKSS